MAGDGDGFDELYAAAYRRIVGHAGPAVSPDRVDLHRALGRLPSRHREVLVLHHVAELPLEEVARQLRVPLGTVKSRLNRARRPWPSSSASTRRGSTVPEDLLGQQLLEYVRHAADAAVPPGSGAIRRRGRRHYRRVAALTAAGVLLAAGLGVGLGLRGGGTTPTVDQPDPPPATNTLPLPTSPPGTATPTTPTTPPPTSAATMTRPARDVVLRPDGLGVAAFGASRQQALNGLRGRLGPPDEAGSWNGATPFGTCPGDTRAVRWGRLYVLFTNGPTRYAPSGTWHLFAYQVDAVQRTKVNPNYSGPTPPPDPPPLRGFSPETAAGIGFGSTLAELRAAYGGRLSTSFGPPGNVHRFRVRLGAAGELFGSLSGGTPAATITGLAAGAPCGE